MSDEPDLVVKVPMRVEQRGRLRAIERSLAYVGRDSAEQRAACSGRFERVPDWLERIERRLGSAQ